MLHKTFLKWVSITLSLALTFTIAPWDAQAAPINKEALANTSTGAETLAAPSAGTEALAKSMAEPFISPEAMADPSASWVPVSQYVEDTDYNVPADYMVRKDGVDYGQAEDIQYVSTATNSTRKAKVILPAGYHSGQKYPVLYLLHGIFGNEETLYNDQVQTVIGNAIASGDSEKMIVVLPNACANETGTPPDQGFSLEHYAAYDNFINDFKDCLMPYINSHFSVATGRENTAISGFSMGGRVSLHIGFTLQDTVRYIGALNPAFGILEYENYGVHEDGLFTEESFTLQPEYWDDTLVLIAAGTNDSIVRDEPERYHNTLAKNGVPHIYYATDGVNANGQTGDGGHNGDVYKHGLYNFMRRIFHQQPTPAPATEPIFRLSFDNAQEGLESAGARVTVHGTPGFANDGTKGKAITMDGDSFLEIAKSDGSSFLTGCEALTISYWSKTASKTNWATYLSPDSSSQNYGQEKYLGIMDNNETVTVERYRNSGSRPPSVSGKGKADAWKHVAVVITENETRLFLDGKRAGVKESSHKLSDILGSNSIFYIGKANWGAGEYYNGQMDEYSIYGFAMTDTQVNNLCHGRDLDDDSFISTETMQRYYDRLSLGNAVPDGAVMSEAKLNLPAELDGASIAWTSSQPEILGADGTVHLPQTETEVTLTARISLDGATATKKFIVPVIPVSGQKAYFEQNFLIPSTIARELTLPTSFGQGHITWSGSAVSADGKITADGQAQDASLTAAWQCDGASASKTFSVKILAQDAIALEAYTRTPLAKDVYSGKLSYSLHLAHRTASGAYESLYSNHGILYAKADISERGTLMPKNLKNPYVFAMAGGGYGIVAVRTDSANEEMANAADEASKGKALLFTTEDFIHYQEAGLIDLQKNVIVADISCEYDSSAGQYVLRWCDVDGNYYKSTATDIRSLSAETQKGGIFGFPSQQLPAEGACGRNQFYVPGEIAKAAIQKFSTLQNTAVQVPDSITASSQEDVDQVFATLRYSDGSTATKKVDWNTSRVDFAKPGTYRISGTVQRAPSMKASNSTSLGVNRADPCAYYNPDDGYYYFIATNDQNQNRTFSIKKAQTLEALKDAPETEILNLDMYPDINGMLWAPEIHKVEGELYIFFSANPGDGWNVQSHVMHFKGGELTDKNNWEKPILFQNQKGGPLNEAMADFGGITLDMTTFQVNGTQYVAWAQRDYGRSTGSVLCIGTVDPKEPWKLTSSPVIISRPDYGWDNNDNTPVDEGPYAIIREGKVFLTFSGSSVGATYCVGLLSADSDADLLDAGSWHKSNFPILYARAVEGEAGPGHNSYTTDAAGNLVFVYHARPVNADGSVGSRNSGLRTVHFGADGEPVLYMSGELELAKANETVEMDVIVKDAGDPDKPEPDKPGPDKPEPDKPDSERPGQVVNAKATATASSIKLSWKSAAGADGYQVYRKKGDTGSYTLIADTRTAATSYQDESLPSATAYCYRIYAYKNHNGEKRIGKASATVKALTLPGKVQKAALKQQGKVSTKSKAVLRFQQAARANVYYIYKYNTSQKKYLPAFQIKDKKIYAYQGKKYVKTGTAALKNGIYTATLTGLNLKKEKTQTYIIKAARSLKGYPTAIGAASKSIKLTAVPEATLKTKSLTVKRGKKKPITIANKKKGASYTFRADKKAIISVSKKGIVTGRKTGTAKITVWEKYNGKTRTLGTVKVKVKK